MLDADFDAHGLDGGEVERADVVPGEALAAGLVLALEDEAGSAVGQLLHAHGRGTELGLPDLLRGGSVGEAAEIGQSGPGVSDHEKHRHHHE